MPARNQYIDIGNFFTAGIRASSIFEYLDAILSYLLVLEVKIIIILRQIFDRLRVQLFTAFYSILIRYRLWKRTLLNDGL